MGTAKALIGGAIFGAGAMYFLDSRMGRRRRKLAADRLRHLSRQAAEGIDAGIRDLRNRSQGLLHQVGLTATPGGAKGGGQSPGGRGFKWSPGPRMLAAACGSALMANCAICRTPTAALLGTLGFGMFNRALGGRCEGIDVLKSMEIGAPIEQVFSFFSHPENYLRISDAITGVELFENGRFAKQMAIAGVPVRFEERFVKMDENKLIQTHSEPRSAIEYCKQLCFESLGDDRTRLHLHFRYQPPGGAMGHAVATLLGCDAKTLLTDLLMRAKYFLETGREPRDAAARHGRRAVRHESGRPGPPRWAEDGQPTAFFGQGAPTEDVQHSGLGRFEVGAAAWPPSRTALPRPEATFPPAF